MTNTPRPIRLPAPRYRVRRVGRPDPIWTGHTKREARAVALADAGIIERRHGKEWHAVL